MNKANRYLHLDTGDVVSLAAMQKAVSDNLGKPYFFKAGGPDDEDIAAFGYANIYHGQPPGFDPETHKIVSDGHEEIDGKWFTKWSVAARPPEEIETSLIAHLVNYRCTRETGGFTFSGLFIPTDEKTERRIIGARVKAEADPDYVISDWTTDGGATTHTLNAATIIAISDAFDRHVQKCFSAMVAVRQSIDSYTTAAQVQDAFDAAYAGE